MTNPKLQRIGKNESTKVVWCFKVLLSFEKFNFTVLEKQGRRKEVCILPQHRLNADKNA